MLLASGCSDTEFQPGGVLLNQEAANWRFPKVEKNVSETIQSSIFQPTP